MAAVHPIRDLGDLERMKEYLFRGNVKYYILFTIGLNTGLRISDILNLKVSDVRGKSHVTIVEKKSKKPKRFLINSELKADIDFFLKYTPDDRYLICGTRDRNKRMRTAQAYRMISDAAKYVGITDAVGTHTMRKTFGYHHYKKNKDIVMLMRLFNHSKPDTTLLYIGITDDEMDASLEGFHL